MVGNLSLPELPLRLLAICSLFRMQLLSFQSGAAAEVWARCSSLILRWLFQTTWCEKAPKGFGLGLLLTQALILQGAQGHCSPVCGQAGHTPKKSTQNALKKKHYFSAPCLPAALISGAENKTKVLRKLQADGTFTKSFLQLGAVSLSVVTDQALLGTSTCSPLTAEWTLS